MGLMQFLTVGRSLGRISDHPSRYKMTRQNLLPKFGSLKRSAKERGETEPTTGSNESKKPSAAVAGQKSMTPYRKAAEAPVKAGIISRIAGKLKFKKPMQTIEVQTTTFAPPGEAKPVFPLGRWTMLSNVPLFKNPFAREPKSKAAQPPVQAELCLDAIKPVRNDLSDCDLEIVTSAKRAIEMYPCESTERADRVPAELAGVGAAEQPGEIAWDQIKTQFFGAGKP